MSGGYVVGGVLATRDGRLYSTSVRFEMRYAPCCWRCGEALYGPYGDEVVASGDPEHPWVWVCSGCLSPDDVSARQTSQGPGVR